LAHAAPGARPQIQRLYWDSEVPGLGVHGSGVSTDKAYIVQHRLKNGMTRRVTLGSCAVLDPDGPEGAGERARGAAVLAAIYSGAHPKAPRRKAGDKAEAKEALTLGKALERFIKERNPPLRSASGHGEHLSAHRRARRSEGLGRS